MLTIQPLPYVQGHSSRDAWSCRIFEEIVSVESHASALLQSEVLSLNDEEQKSLLKEVGISDEIKMRY